jgi:hypothetical protein
MFAFSDHVHRPWRHLIGLFRNEREDVAAALHSDETRKVGRQAPEKREH